MQSSCSSFIFAFSFAKNLAPKLKKDAKQNMRGKERGEREREEEVLLQEVCRSGIGDGTMEAIAKSTRILP